MLPALALAALLLGAPELEVQSAGEDVSIGGTSLRKITGAQPLELDIREATAGDELVVDVVRLSSQRGSTGQARLSVAVGLEVTTIAVRGAVVDERRAGKLYASRAVRHRVQLPLGASHIVLRTDAPEGIAVGLTTSTPNPSRVRLVPLVPPALRPPPVRGTATTPPPPTTEPPAPAPAPAPSTGPASDAPPRPPRSGVRPSPRPAPAEVPERAPPAEPALPVAVPPPAEVPLISEPPPAAAAAPAPVVEARAPGPALRLIAQVHLSGAAAVGNAVSPLSAGGGARVLLGLRAPGPDSGWRSVALGAAVDVNQASAVGGASPRAARWSVAFTRVRVEGAWSPVSTTFGPLDIELGLTLGVGAVTGLHTIVVGSRTTSAMTGGPTLRLMPEVAVQLGPGRVVFALPLDVEGDVVGDVRGRAVVAAAGLLGYRLEL